MSHPASLEMPDVTLQDFTRHEVRPSAFRGKNMLLNVWEATTLSLAEISDLKSLQAGLK